MARGEVSGRRACDLSGYLVLIRKPADGIAGGIRLSGGREHPANKSNQPASNETQKRVGRAHKVYRGSRCIGQSRYYVRERWSFGVHQPSKIESRAITDGCLRILVKAGHDLLKTGRERRPKNT